jgi:hypothetical protein
MKKMKIINARISIGVPYIPDGATIPTVCINVYSDGEDGKQYLSTGYLTPFRRYCFQVSLNERGDCDMGSSPVIGDMRHVLNYLIDPELPLDPCTGKSFLNGQAVLAVQAFIPSYALGRQVFVEKFSYKYFSKDFLCLTQDENLKNWSKFIDMCYDWIKG